MEPKTIILIRGDEKKYSWVYLNKEEGIPGLYIPKGIVGVDAPKQIKMTLEAD